MANEESTFRLVPLSKVKESILAIAAKAKELGLTSAIKSRLLTITEKLAREPEKWGDPLYATAKSDGMVYRGFFSPFVVNYTVFVAEKLVLVWEFRVMDDRLGTP